MKVSKKEIGELKVKYGEIHTLTVNNKNGEPVTMILREIDRTVYKSISAIMQKDEMLGVEALLKNLRVGGDKLEAITEDFKALRNASVTVIPLLEAETGELKKN
jgi:hypothetical protein